MPSVNRPAAAKGVSKKKAKTFVIDCSKPVNDKIMDIASFEKFLLEHIKVEGKTGSQPDSCRAEQLSLKATWETQSRSARTKPKLRSLPKSISPKGQP